VIDLDRFKQVNDSVGIAVGDSILLTLARRLTRILKPQDTLAVIARRADSASQAIDQQAWVSNRENPKLHAMGCSWLKSPVGFNNVIFANNRPDHFARTFQLFLEVSDSARDIVPASP